MKASSNIWCDFYSGEMGCARIEPYGRSTLRSNGAAAKATFVDGPPGAEPVGLSYGQPVTVNGYACIAQEIGLSCWNLKSGHGMFRSRS